MRPFAFVLALCGSLAFGCTKTAKAPVAPPATPTCTDGVKNGSETDVDCGGSCGACADGKGCAAAADCASGVCGADQKCAAPACTDHVKNGGETDVDCGGSCGATCATGKTCASGADCIDKICGGDHRCAAPSCTDGVQNGGESDVDCGHVCSSLCGDGKGCLAAGDCTSGACGGDHKCAAPTCTDRVQNGGETDVDCGHVCSTLCGDGKGCLAAGDCTSGVCGGGHKCAAPSCTDRMQNGGESDVDCGHVCSTLCALGQKCLAASDCGSGSCGAGRCVVAATCSDGVKDGGETDVDCGGPGCLPCAAGLKCSADSDCTPGIGCGAGGICGSAMAPSSTRISLFGAVHDNTGALHVLTAEGYSGNCFTKMFDHVLANGVWTSNDTGIAAPSGWGLGGAGPVVTSTGEIVLFMPISQYCYNGARGTDTPYLATWTAAKGWSWFLANGTNGPMLAGTQEFGAGGGWAMRVDANDVIHAAISYYGASQAAPYGPYSIAYYQWTLDAGGKPVNTAHSPQALFPQNPSGAPNLWVDLDGQLHLVFDTYYTGNSYHYRSSTDGGLTWSDETFDTKQIYDDDGAIGVLGSGAGKMVFTSHISNANGSTLGAQLRSASSWSTDLSVSGASNSYYPFFQTNGAALSLFYRTQDGSGNYRLTMRTRSSTAWSDPVSLDAGASGYSDIVYAFPGSTWPAFNRDGAAGVEMLKVWQSSSPSWLLLRDVR